MLSRKKTKTAVAQSKSKRADAAFGAVGTAVDGLAASAEGAAEDDATGLLRRGLTKVKGTPANGKSSSSMRVAARSSLAAFGLRLRAAV